MIHEIINMFIQSMFMQARPKTKNGDIFQTDILLDILFN